MREKGFKARKLSPETRARFAELARVCRGDVLKMTTLAACGHPGGSMSSMETYVLLWNLADVGPDRIHDPGRDRIVVSHGHTSPGVYSVLGRLGYVNIDDAVAHFRQGGSLFEGHVERTVPGVEWSTGNLGQGLSAGVSFALASRYLKKDYHVFVVMGDGEQQKGQIVEAQRFAVKYHLTNITVIVDRNYLQISGDTRKVMPMDIPAQYKASGWKVFEVADGNDLDQMYAAIRRAKRYRKAPAAIIARTVMSKGVPFMEDKEEWHGKALPEEECRKALAILGLPDDIEKCKAMRAAFKPGAHATAHNPPVKVNTGAPRTYLADKKSDCRGAWGAAIADLAEANKGEGAAPIVVFDCDLASSVRTEGFAKILPDNFIQAGITEHNTCAMAGAMSTQGVLAFWADFAVFGTDETYNQHRLNDINGASVKVVITHCGTDVGEDGKTHQCIDYVGTFRNIYGYHVICPADPNETDRAVRYAASHEGNFVLAMGRSKMPTVTAEDGSPVFAGNYEFQYGKATFVREGRDVCIIAMGPMVGRALIVHDLLGKKGISAGVLNMSSPTAPDSAALRKAAQAKVVAAYEDHNVRTGLAAVVSEFFAQEGLSACFLRFGITRYASSGTPEELLKLQGIDPETVAEVTARVYSTGK